MNQTLLQMEKLRKGEVKYLPKTHCWQMAEPGFKSRLITDWQSKLFTNRKQRLLPKPTELVRG